MSDPLDLPRHNNGSTTLSASGIAGVRPQILKAWLFVLKTSAYRPLKPKYSSLLYLLKINAGAGHSVLYYSPGSSYNQTEPAVMNGKWWAFI